MQDTAVKLLLAQANLLCADWAVGELGHQFTRNGRQCSCLSVVSLGYL